MADPAHIGRTARAWWAAAALVSAVVIAGCGSFGTRDAGETDREFDIVEGAFDADPQPFVAAVNYMEQLQAVSPEAEQIRWTSSRICTTGPGGNEECDATSAADNAAFEALPHNTSAVSYHAKDADRIFIVFNSPEPPVIYLMYAPLDDRPAAFANDRDFRSIRELGDGWTLLGNLDDLDAYDEQFPRPQFPDSTF